jgi:hypothetical protein
MGTSRARLNNPEVLVQEPKQNRRPWHAYRSEPNRKLLEPGWAGSLDDDELGYIQEHLKADDKLSFAWGFRPGQKMRSEAAIRRIAMHGDPDCRATNVKLARTRRAETPAKSRR